MKSTKGSPYASNLVMEEMDVEGEAQCKQTEVLESLKGMVAWRQLDGRSRPLLQNLIQKIDEVNEADEVNNFVM